MSELKPCPFCGKINFKRYEIGIRNHKQKMVKCMTSNCLLWDKAFYEEKWNIRHEHSIRQAICNELLGEMPEKMKVEQIMNISLESPVDRILCGQYHNQAIDTVTTIIKKMGGGLT